MTFRACTARQDLIITAIISTALLRCQLVLSTLHPSFHERLEGVWPGSHMAFTLALAILHTQVLYFPDPKLPHRVRRRVFSYYRYERHPKECECQYVGIRLLTHK